MTKNMLIAQTITKQIGQRALMMLGAKNFIAIDNGVGFKVRGSKTVTHIRITLNNQDLYDMEFLKITRAGYESVAIEESVYNDMLNTLIEKHTGLYTQLF